MSSYDVQRRKLFPIIREAILKAYNEYGLGLDEDLAGCETMHIFKDITNEGIRIESEGVWMTYHCTNGGRSPRGRSITYRTFTCDACGKSNGRRKTPYCPNCGAKMKGGAE
jgi:hypothetical protein